MFKKFVVLHILEFDILLLLLFLYPSDECPLDDLGEIGEGIGFFARVEVGDAVLDTILDPVAYHLIEETVS